MASDQRSELPRGDRGASLTIAVVADPGGVALEVAGALDYSTADRLSTAVLHEFGAGAGVVTVDLGGVGFCDSSGVAALVRAHKAAVRQGRRFVVRRADTTLDRVFALTGLDAVLTIEA
ncbi:STAS domain-containing protein [Dactylosporangium sp. CA-233914]|uniref:STAS domain-containing protein n=1 Tax=Dactylosporangium sp. CA-233914 TaxID=3239934 RepID=UPI003D8FE3BE